jgi:hypothetical protein
VLADVNRQSNVILLATDVNKDIESLKLQVWNHLNNSKNHCSTYYQNSPALPYHGTVLIGLIVLNHIAMEHLKAHAD